MGPTRPTEARRPVATQRHDDLARERAIHSPFKLGKPIVDKLLTGLFSERTRAIVDARTGPRRRALGRAAPRSGRSFAAPAGAAAGAARATWLRMRSASARNGAASICAPISAVLPCRVIAAIAVASRISSSLVPPLRVRVRVVRAEVAADQGAVAGEEQRLVLNAWRRSIRQRSS